MRNQLHPAIRKKLVEERNARLEKYAKQEAFWFYVKSVIWIGVACVCGFAIGVWVYSFFINPAIN